MIRRVTDPEDPAIAAFGRLQERSYADSDLLIPPKAFPQLVAHQSDDRTNFLLLAEHGKQVVGGTVFHYFPGPNTGFSSFMAVGLSARGRGLARALHGARFEYLDQEAGGRVSGLFIDVVAPERLSAAEWADERAIGADPVARRAVFQRLGFRRVDVAYYQPPDSADGPKITNMDLLWCPRQRGEKWVATDLVVGTMHAYWRPWMGNQIADTHAVELRRLCGGPQVALQPAYRPSK